MTIDIHLNFSEQRTHFHVPGQKEPRCCSSFFVDCGGACFAKVSEPRSDLRREQPGQLQIQNGPVEPLPRASTVRTPTHTRRSTTTGQGLAEDLENVITLEPVGNQIIDGLLEGAPHRESCLGVMHRTLETMAGVQRLQEDRAWNRQRRSSLMKRLSSPSYRLDFLRRGVLWHIQHGWCDPCAVRALGIEQLRQRLDRMATRDSTEFHSAHAEDIVSFKAARREPTWEPPALFVARKTAQHHFRH